LYGSQISQQARVLVNYDESQLLAIGETPDLDGGSQPPPLDKELYVPLQYINTENVGIPWYMKFLAPKDDGTRSGTLPALAEGLTTQKLVGE
jgi:hypothetical protein